MKSNVLFGFAGGAVIGILLMEFLWSRHDEKMTLERVWRDNMLALIQLNALAAEHERRGEDAMLKELSLQMIESANLLDDIMTDFDEYDDETVRDSVRKMRKVAMAIGPSP